MILSSGDSGGSESCSPGAPRAFWLIFLPLLSTAQILSFINIDWEGEGAARLELSSGVAFIQGSARDTWHIPHRHPIHPQRSHVLQSETFPTRLPFSVLLPCKILLSAFSHQCFPLRSPWDPSLGFPAEWERETRRCSPQSEDTLLCFPASSGSGGFGSLCALTRGG